MTLLFFFTYLSSVLGPLFSDSGSSSSSSESGENKCGRHAEYLTCGTACPETCTYIPEACATVCVSGCFCKKGYVRATNAANSRCIKRSQCSD